MKITDVEYQIDGKKYRSGESEVEIAKSDIFSEPGYIRYPSQKWDVLKLKDFTDKFGDISAH